MRLSLTRRTLVAALAAAPLLSACGFRLRGHFQAPFDTLYLQLGENTRLGGYLKRLIEAGSNVRCVASAKEAEAVLEFLRIERSRDVLSINALGRAREYELTLTIEFRVTAPDDGFEFVPATTLVTSRDLTYSESEFLSRETEEEVLYRDMENDLSAQLVRYLEASRTPK